MSRNGAARHGCLCGDAQYRAGWRAGVVAIALVAAVPLSIVAFLASDPYVAIACFALPAALLGAYIGPDLG
jgi:hypothetical protein